MQILLIAATQHEILPYLQTNPHHDVLITGVGIASTTYRLTRKMLHHHYDLVIQAGIAGSEPNSFLALGDVAWITQDAFGDLGAWENGEFKAAQDLQLSTEPAWISNIASGVVPDYLPQAKAITVSLLSDNAALRNALHQRWQADIESMEGAAAAFVCKEKQVPFVQIRSVSNRVGERDKSRWEMEKAIANLNNALAHYVYSLNQ
jgi:futalosine hydrolase